MTLTLSLRDLTVGTGTSYEVMVDGTNWRTPPAFRAEYPDINGRHGVHAGADLLGIRRIAFTITIDEPTMAAALAAERIIAGAFAPSDIALPLVIVDDNGEWTMWGRPQPASPDFTYADVGLITVECRFAATDPLLYSVEATQTVGWPAGSEGHTFPHTFPLVFGAAGETGVVSVSNPGTMPAPWSATIDGPWVNPTVTLLGHGDTIEVTISLGTGDQLVLDSRDRSIILNGTASRASAIRAGSRWFDLPVGSSEVRFGGASGSGQASLAWRGADL